MNILILAAHPDDEVLGCGGTLYKLSKDKNNKIMLAFAADGVSSRKDCTLKEINQRKKAMFQVAQSLGAQVFNKNTFPFKDQKLETVYLAKIINWIEKIFKQFQPDVVYTHWAGDLNQDHRIVGEATLVASRTSSYLVKYLYYYEIPESTHEGSLLYVNQFRPNVYEKINLVKKKHLITFYQTEINRSDKWIKGVTALGYYRGFSSSYDFAEAFMLVRQRND